MTKLTNAQKQANYRARKEVVTFFKDYLPGCTATAEGFIEAKELEHCNTHRLGGVSFDQWFLNNFYGCLNKYTPEGDQYHGAELIKAWKAAAKINT